MVSSRRFKSSPCRWHRGLQLRSRHTSTFVSYSQHPCACGSQRHDKGHASQHGERLSKRPKTRTQKISNRFAEDFNVDSYPLECKRSRHGGSVMIMRERETGAFESSQCWLLNQTNEGGKDAEREGASWTGHPRLVECNVSWENDRESMTIVQGG